MCVLGTRAQRGDHGESVPRGRRAGEEGADPWGRAVSGVGRRGLSGLLRERGGRDRPAAGPCRAGPSGRLRGQRWQAERGGAGLAEALGRSGLGWGLAAWAGLVFYLTGFFSFYFSLSNSKLFSY